jgi:hypothetical protein
VTEEMPLVLINQQVVQQLQNVQPQNLELEGI